MSFSATICDVFGRNIPEKVPPIMMMSCGTTSMMRKSATAVAPSEANMPSSIGRDWVAVIWNSDKAKIERLKVMTALKSSQCHAGQRLSISPPRLQRLAYGSNAMATMAVTMKKYSVRSRLAMNTRATAAPLSNACRHCTFIVYAIWPSAISSWLNTVVTQLNKLKRQMTNRQRRMVRNWSCSTANRFSPKKAMSSRSATFMADMMM